MSRHRDTVHELAGTLGDAALAEATDVVAQQLLGAGQLEAVIELSAAAGRSVAPGLEGVAASLESIVRSAAITDVQEMDVVIQLSPRERIGHCVGSGGGSSRRFQMVDIAVRARIKSRWVHMWEERQATRQWVLD
jgi:hypothetical protein